MKTVIIYDKFWKDYYHNGSMIVDMEKFISGELNKGNIITFKVQDDGEDI